MTDKPEKFYLVNDRQIKDLCDAAVLEYRMSTSTASYTSPKTGRERLINALSDCRKIEVREEIVPGLLEAIEMWNDAEAR